MNDPIRHRAAVVCMKDGKLLAIELQDPATGARFWSLPGGEIEKGETPAEAAIRETQEETGCQVRLTSDAWVSRYAFPWNGKQVQCETSWFRAELIKARPDPTPDAPYLLNVAWQPWPESRTLFTYHPAIEGGVKQMLGEGDSNR